MKIIKILFTLFLSLLIVHVSNYPAIADSPKAENDYIKITDDGDFVFVMLSIANDKSAYGQGLAFQVREIRKKYSRSGLYRNDGSTNPVWTIDWYAFDVDMSFDGRYLVRWGPWAFSDNYSELALAFYRDGRQIKRYRVNELVAEPQLLPHSVNHYAWYRRRSFDPRKNTLYVETNNNEIYNFNVSTVRVIEEPVKPTADLNPLINLLLVTLLTAGLAITLVTVFSARNRKKEAVDHGQVV